MFDSSKEYDMKLLNFKHDKNPFETSGNLSAQKINSASMQAIEAS